MRRGCRRSASAAPGSPRTGSVSPVADPSGASWAMAATADFAIGSRGGMRGGSMLLIADQIRLVSQRGLGSRGLGLREEQMSERSKNRFVETSLHRVVPQELHRQMGRTHDRPQDPGQLTAQKKVSAQPEEQHT